MGEEEREPASLAIAGCDLLERPGSVRPGVDLLVVDGVISSIGPVGSTAIPEGARVIDGSGLLALPGLVNAHSHSPENCLRGFGEGLLLEPWLLRMFGSSGLYDEESHYLNALAGAVEMLRLGITTVVDHLWMTPPSPEAISGTARAYDEVGIRAGIAPLMNDFDFTGPFASDRDFDLGPALISDMVEFLPTRDLLELFEGAVAEWHGASSGRLRILAGPGGVQWCSDELLAGLAESARRNETGFHIHLLETGLQREVCEHRFGQSPIEAMADRDLLWAGTSLPHSVWIEPEEIEIIASTGATVVHNPAANLRLGSGRCPVPGLLEAGANVALGTDGSASSDNQNSWEMVKLASLVHNDGQHWVSAGQALTMATSAGARVLDPASTGGVLAEGAPADIALLDRQSAGLAGAQEIEASLALSESGRSVRHVVVDGRVVVEDGRCLTVDEEAVFAALADEAARRHPSVVSPSEQSIEAVDRIETFIQSLQRGRHSVSVQ